MAYLSVNEGRIKSLGHKGKKLTPLMVSFIDAYFGEANFNAGKAMQLSNYKCKNSIAQAAELMNHPLVQEEIKRRQAIRTAKSEVSAELLIIKLMQIIEAEQDRNPQAALRAIELAGKSIALWKERQEISGPDGEAIKHEQHVKESVADFTSRISSLAQRTGTDGTNIIPIRGTARRTEVDVEVLGETEPKGT